jgi:hypothetical protein
MISPTFDPEQQAVMDALAADYATQTGTPCTTDEYCETVLIGIANDGKLKAIQAKGASVVEAALSLPDDKRLAFNAAVDAAFAKISAS